MVSCLCACACGLRFCFACRAEAHAPCDCKAAARWLERDKGAQNLDSKFLLEQTKPCPKCGCRTEKSGGYSCCPLILHSKLLVILLLGLLLEYCSTYFLE